VHNFDVMHQECNICENILSTCMGFTDKIKDNHKVKRDLAQICDRPTLELRDKGSKPCAPFYLKPKERKEVMSWMQDWKFPYGYTTGLRRDVNLETVKINRLKSHDYHIFMKRLLPVMFHGYLIDDVWTTLAELSHFYRQLCGKEIKKEMIEKLEKEIPVLLCKLEKIFPPGWFNAMQHLLLHLPYEAKIGGPLQYRWMYHIERALKKHTLQGITMSTHLLYGTMWMKTFLVVTFKFFNGRARLFVPPQHTIQLRKNRRLLCSTCTQIWMRWNNISCKCMLFSFLIVSWWFIAHLFTYSFTLTVC
jgi:hypothetical protein